MLVNVFQIKSLYNHLMNISPLYYLCCNNYFHFSWCSNDDEFKKYSSEYVVLTGIIMIYVKLCIVIVLLLLFLLMMNFRHLLNRWLNEISQQIKTTYKLENSVTLIENCRAKLKDCQDREYFYQKIVLRALSWMKV